MKLVVIIPALNEQATITEVLTNIPQDIEGISEISTIVVNDGSTDNTASLATQAGATVVSHQTPRGVGAAFHTGIKHALVNQADIIVNIDSDGQFDAKDIPKLIKPIQNKQVDFITTTRFADPANMPDMPAIKIWGNKWMTRIINFLTNKHFTDVSCGFRAYSRDAALRLSLFGHFTYTQETFIDLAFKQISMTEISLPVKGEREHGRSRVASNLWRYGIKSATIIFRAARDYQPFYFIGLPGLVISALGLLAGLFVLNNYILTGQTFPYRSLVPASGALITIGFLLLVVSMVADMVHRNRVLIEEQLYLTRKQTYSRNE